METYGISDFVTGDLITEGLQGRDGLRVAVSCAQDREEPVHLWSRSGGSWRVEPNGSWVGWDSDHHHETADGGPEGA